MSGILDWEFSVIMPVLQGDMSRAFMHDLVMDGKWGRWDDVVRAVEATPFVFSPWSVLQVERLAVTG